MAHGSLAQIDKGLIWVQMLHKGFNQIRSIVTKLAITFVTRLSTCACIATLYVNKKSGMMSIDANETRVTFDCTRSFGSSYASNLRPCYKDSY
ncbi:hypothetical protein VNO77_19650 [Canavalia gladiata]|uniref:Uncharacterized protein n=1 Tax=Canavalia gladiata TaxID=3824 RepID=A0AAN9LNS8_CANGL